MIRTVVIMIVALLAFTAGWLSRPLETGKGKNSRPTLAAAFPKWPAANCVTANPQERKVFELAIATMEITAEAKNVLWLNIGAQQFLGGDLHRSGPRPVQVCPPYDIYERASDIVTKSEGLKGRLQEYQLKMAAKFPHWSQYIVDAVANSAFNEIPQESEVFKNEDIRPFARSVLAGFGTQASRYAAVSFEKMSADDSLGTGAAQVAAATGHPGALDRIQKMMENILSSIPENRVIPWNVRSRLYELSYAIYFSGDEAKKYSAPIQDLMRRKVENPAPPFGMLESSPKQMCEVLERIEGADSIKGYAYCSGG
jgi:hypothetical protein